MSSRGTRWKRYVHAYWRDVRVLLRQFYIPLLLLVASVLLVGLIFYLCYTHPEVPDLSYIGAVHAIFSMIFFGDSLPLAPQWYLQILHFLMPIVGLGLVAQGVIQFGVMLFSKTAREDEWQVALASTYRDHVLVAGIGRLGYRVVQQLLDFDQDVVGIELDSDSEFVQRVMDQKVPVVFGNAAHTDILQQAGIPRASALVTCTENDLTNLEIALAARELQPDLRIVLRMFDQDIAQKIARGFDIHTAFSTSALAAPAFARAATHSGVSHAFYVNDQLLNVGEMTIDQSSSLIGRQVGTLESELDLSIILHCRADAMDMHPAPDTLLQANDKVWVLASLGGLNHLRDLNSKGK